MRRAKSERLEKRQNKDAWQSIKVDGAFEYLSYDLNSAQPLLLVRLCMEIMCSVFTVTQTNKHTHAYRERKREIRAFKTGMQLLKSIDVYLCTMLYKSTCKYSYRMHIEMTQRSYGLM